MAEPKKTSMQNWALFTCFCMAVLSLSSYNMVLQGQLSHTLKKLESRMELVEKNHADNDKVMNSQGGSFLKELEKRLSAYEATSRFSTYELRKRVSILEKNTVSAVYLRQILSNDTAFVQSRNKRSIDPDERVRNNPWNIYLGTSLTIIKNKTLGATIIALRGPPGVKGKRGKKGKKGEKGQCGKKGRNGKKGQRGERGMSGGKGQIGKNGPIGIRGRPGKAGPAGPKGLKGDQGGVGLKGDAGSVGQKGDKGDLGATGGKGRKGEKGAVGRKGDAAPIQRVFKDCEEAKKAGIHFSGIVKISLPNKSAIDVHCDMVTDGGGWIVFQRRRSSSVSFERDWVTYEQGFGDLSGSFWLGLMALHSFTSAGSWTLRVDLKASDGDEGFAKYTNFRIGNQQTKYKLMYDKFSSGNIGDSLTLGGSKEKRFSTFDRDNDNLGSNCAVRYKGAWWHNTCFHANLNNWYPGTKKTGSSNKATMMSWYEWKKVFGNIVFSEMKIRIGS